MICVAIVQHQHSEENKEDQWLQGVYDYEHVNGTSIKVTHLYLHPMVYKVCDVPADARDLFISQNFSETSATLRDRKTSYKQPLSLLFSSELSASSKCEAPAAKTAPAFVKQERPIQSPRPAKQVKRELSREQSPDPEPAKLDKCAPSKPKAQAKKGKLVPGPGQKQLAFVPPPPRKR